MRIGVPKEIKVHEYRVGLVPAAARELIEAGHEVLVETGAAAGIGFADADYQRVGAKIATTAAEIFAASDMIVKVKEPQPQECAMLRKGQILFTYLHLAPDPKQTEALVKSGATCIAYETVTAPDGSLPLLTPMSEVAGRMSIQVGAYCLQKANGGRGILLGGVPGVAPAKVVILGGGVSGTNAARDGRGPARRRHRGRPLDEAPARTLVDLRRDAAHRVLDAGPHRHAGDGSRPGHRRGADRRRRGAEARHPRHGPAHEARLGAGRHLDRPGRLLRDQPGHDARRSRPTWSTT